MKIYNKTNEHYEEIKKTAMTTEDDFELNKTIDDVEAVKVGNYAYCMNWKQVENILECFDENEDFDIREKENVFFVQGLCGKVQKNKLEKAFNGDLAEAEKEVEIK